MDNSTDAGTNLIAEATEVMMEIPASKAGAVIGRGGETIKRLQDRYCVTMKMNQESTCASGAKTLCITGSAINVENSKKAVMDIVEATLERIPMQPMSTRVAIREVVVPRSAAGVIIGKQGDTIKRLQAETDTKIQFKIDEDPAATERVLVIRGYEENVRIATSRVADLVARIANSQMGTQTEHIRMVVPANKAGLVVGKGGDTIRQIQAETGAWVGMSREPFANPEERIVEIKGTPEQVNMVRHIIRMKIGDIMPGTVKPQVRNITTSYQICNEMRRASSPDKALEKFAVRPLVVRYDSVVEALHKSRVACPLCGIGLNELHGDSYQKHMDWHKNHKEYITSDRVYTRSSPWFMTEDWFSYSEFEIVNYGSVASKEPEEENGPIPEYVITSSNEIKECHVCREKFDEYWDDDEDEWRLRDCSILDGKAVHKACKSDVRS